MYSSGWWCVTLLCQRLSQCSKCLQKGGKCRDFLVSVGNSKQKHHTNAGENPELWLTEVTVPVQTPGQSRGGTSPVLSLCSLAHCSRAREKRAPSQNQGLVTPCCFKGVQSRQCQQPQTSPGTFLWVTCGMRKWGDNGGQFEHCVICSVLCLWKGIKHWNLTLWGNIGLYDWIFHHHLHTWPFDSVCLSDLASLKLRERLVTSNSLGIQLFLNNQVCLI